MNMNHSTENEAETVAVKPVKDIPVVQDEGFFLHHTGDTYNGLFEAKKKDRIAKMHGHGVYITAEGDVYTGTWENDKLGSNAEVTIAFNDNSTYEGQFKDWCFMGHGKYFYPDGSVLTGEFSDNCPVGTLTLLDPNEHVWLGKASLGYGWFQPDNHFYTLLKTRESIKRRRKTSGSPNIDNTSVLKI